MERSVCRGACSWSDIKRQLDPAGSYIVIETAAVSSSAEVFRTITAIVAKDAATIRKQEICREASSGNLLLLIQIDPEQTEAVKNSLLSPNLPSSVTVYFYDPAPMGDGHG